MAYNLALSGARDIAADKLKSVVDFVSKSGGGLSVDQVKMRAVWLKWADENGVPR